MNRRSTAWLIVVILPLLFLPKINLFNFAEGESAGLRVDDIFLLIFSFILFWIRFSLTFQFTQLEKDLALIMGLSIISLGINKFFLFNGILTTQASLPYAVRIFEYFLFFYVGFWSVRHFETKKVVWTFVIINALIICLQRAGLIGGFFLGQYHSNMSGRVTGIAAFPTEMGVLLNFLFAYLIFTKDKIELSAFWPDPFRRFIASTGIFWLFLLFGILTILTGTRAALVALPILLIARLWSLGGAKRKTIILLPLLVLILIPLMKNTEELFLRSQSLFSWHNLDVIGEVWNRIDISGHLDPNGLYIVEASENQDVSWLMRLNKWIFVTKSFLYHPETWLFGLGPGTSGSGLDGGLLRIAVEGGILGSIAYAFFFRHLAAISLTSRWLVVTLLLNMIFVDAHLAYKIMSLFFFLTGAEMGVRQESLQEDNECNLSWDHQKASLSPAFQRFSLGASRQHGRRDSGQRQDHEQ